MDTCIKAGSYCPVCKGVVGRDCWHYASEFKRGANYAEEFFAAKDEIESLRQQLASAQEELHFQACLTRDLMPYQERALKSEQQLAAAQEENKELIFSLQASRSNNRDLRNELAAALAACEEKDAELIERCAEVCEEYQGSAETCAAAIRKLKGEACYQNTSG